MRNGQHENGELNRKGLQSLQRRTCILIIHNHPPSRPSPEHKSIAANTAMSPIVLLRFSKSGKRTVSDGFVKKSADSDSVSDSRRSHYKLIYTGRRMRRRFTSQAIVPGRQDATQPKANVPRARHTPHARTWTSDVAC